MKNTSFPPDENPQNEETTTHQINHKPHYITPQFEIIDDRAKTQSHEEESTQSEKTTSPLSLRFICFLGLIFCSIFGLGMFLMSLVTTVIAALSLFRNPSLNESVLGFWKLSTHALVAGLGFIVGLVSPALGLSLIALYFSVTGKVIDYSLLCEIVKKSFNKF